MNPFFTYLIETNVYLAIFATAYGILLRSETFFRLNRLVLLGMVAIAFLLPLISFPAIQGALSPYTVVLPAFEVGSGVLASQNDWNFSLVQFAMFIYGIGVLLLGVRFLTQLFSTLHLINASTPVQNTASGLVEIPSHHVPASFFHFLFWNQNVCKENADMIRDHEAVHATEWHSLDLLLIRFVQIICWFNPAVHYIRKAVEANHEFRADEVVANQHNDIYQYSNVLLGQAMGINHTVLAHHFSKPNLLKTRIMMLNKRQSKKSALLKYLFLIPVLGLALAFNACTKESEEVTETTEGIKSLKPEIEALISEKGVTGKKIPGTDIYQVVEVMPTFEGGDRGLMTWLGENITYPEAAKESGAEGKVFVQFVVDKDGHIRDFEQFEGQKSAGNGPSPILVEAALKAISEMPAWTPGSHKGEKVNVQYILPIKFQLD
jgi:hypothetical protein